MPDFALQLYSKTSLAAVTRLRAGEVRIGEKVRTLNLSHAENWADALADSPARYVLLGLPEDVGVRANMGRGGAYSAWQPALSSLLNIQSNMHFRGDELLLLGHVDFSQAMEHAKDLDFRRVDGLNAAREIVARMDEVVSEVLYNITKAGKEAIVIGGGHNNAYGCLRGSSLAHGSAMACINCDAHSDLRPLEGRHSGNGFTYALEEGLLDRYAMLGLHEIFNSEAALEKIEKDERLDATFFEDIFIRERLSFRDAIDRALRFTGSRPLGLELDLDTVQNIPSSAKTSSGLSTIQARQFVHRVATHARVSYFHIAEAAPVLSHLKTDLKTGKLIAYLVTDYIKARNSYT